VRDEGVGEETDEGQATPSEGMDDEIASWKDAGPLIENAGPRGPGGPEEGGPWWPGTPEETPAAVEWEATWGPRDADEDEPEWFGTSEETAPATQEDLGGSIWGEAAEEAGDDAGSVWHTPEAGDNDSLWTADDQPIWAEPGGSSSEAFPEPPAPAAEGPEVPPAPPAAEAPPAPTADAAEGTPAPDSGDPVTTESSEGESAGFRTVALQELRNLAGVAGTPVRLPGSARRPADEGASAPSSPAPKIRALKRLIAAVRGL
jgi:hypothetical protein